MDLLSRKNGPCHLYIGVWMDQMTGMDQNMFGWIKWQVKMYRMSRKKGPYVKHTLDLTSSLDGLYFE